MIGTRDVLGRRIRIVGVVAKTADTYRRSVAAGRIVPTKSALPFADGIAVPARRDGTRGNSATGAASAALLLGL